VSTDAIYLATVWAIPVIIAITFHEAAHGFVAHLLGDDTAWWLGRVGLNPAKHIDPFGTLVLPGILLLLHAPFLFGYAKPVPVNFRKDTIMIRLPQDPGGAGKFQAYYLVGKLQGYNVTTEREEGSKPYRANPFAAQCEHGFVSLVDAPWNDAFVEELCAFPNGAHDDQVDAASAAFRALVRRPHGIWQLPNPIPSSWVAAFGRSCFSNLLHPSRSDLPGVGGPGRSPGNEAGAFFCCRVFKEETQ
jgi:predicted phage terminase large subunit-like protein